MSSPQQRLGDETREDHPVDAGLTRAHRVEQPGDDDLGAALGGSRRRGSRRVDLCVGIGPAGLARAIRARDPRPRATRRCCSCRRSRRWRQDQRVRNRAASRDNGLHAVDVAEHRLQRPIDDQLHPDGRGEVKAGVGAGKLGVDGRRSVTQPSTKETLPSRCSMFAIEPVLRSSRMVTRSPGRPARRQGATR